MTEEQEAKCHAIIHGHAVLAAAGNAVPVPGLGIAADTVTLTTMAMSLAAVFGSDSSITEEAAKGIAISALKKQVLKQPIKIAAKELSKLVPGLGQVVAPAISVGMLEAAGWFMAKDLEKRA